MTIWWSRSAFIITPARMNESSSSSTHFSSSCANRSALVAYWPSCARPCCSARIGTSPRRSQTQRHMSPTNASLPSASGDGRLASLPRALASCHSWILRNFLLILRMAHGLRIDCLPVMLVPSGSGGCSAACSPGRVALMTQRRTKGVSVIVASLNSKQAFCHPSGNEAASSGLQATAHCRRKSPSPCELEFSAAS